MFPYHSTKVSLLTKYTKAVYLRRNLPVDSNTLRTRKIEYLNVSFTSLLNYLDAGTLQFADLERTLFSFGCARSYLFEHDQAELHWGSNLPRRRSILEQIQKEVLHAEGEGRVVYMNNNDGYEQAEYPSTLSKAKRLNKLLNKWGFESIPREYNCIHNYPDIARGMIQSANKLTVIWDL